MDKGNSTLIEEFKEGDKIQFTSGPRYYIGTIKIVKNRLCVIVENKVTAAFKLEDCKQIKKLNIPKNI